MKQCPRCRTSLPEQAKFCINCGAPQAASAVKAPEFQLDFDKDLSEQLSALFFAELRKRVEEENLAARFQEYSERAYTSGFRDTIQRRAVLLESQIHTLYSNLEHTDGDLDRHIRFFCEELLDQFIIQHCKDLNAVELPEAILQHQKQIWSPGDLFQISMDYLDFQNEQETVYTDFLAMPIDKLRNAAKAFLFSERTDERIFFICDLSLLGNCKEGFALTEKALYWKSPLEKARRAGLDQLYDLRRKENWITVNEFFFNANPALNIKLLKLLKGIQLRFSQDW
ncbi:MAG: zinc ribbon domain-containing protein [Saprospiraceae bacterium]